MGFPHVIERKTNCPVLGHILRFPVFRADGLRMVPELMIEHVAQHQIAKKAYPTQ